MSFLTQFCQIVKVKYLHFQAMSLGVISLDPITIGLSIFLFGSGDHAVSAASNGDWLDMVEEHKLAEIVQAKSMQRTVSVDGMFDLYFTGLDSASPEHPVTVTVTSKPHRQDVRCSISIRDDHFAWMADPKLVDEGAVDVMTVRVSRPMRYVMASVMCGGFGATSVTVSYEFKGLSIPAE